jgi:hypothetical protein
MEGIGCPETVADNNRVSNRFGAFETISFGSSPGHPETVTHTDHFSYTQTRQPISGRAAAAPLPLEKLHRQQSNSKAALE